ncbi:hypothetical protein [Microbacterium arborescens]
MLSDHTAAAEARLNAHAKLAGKLHDTVRRTEEGGLVADNYVVFGVTLPGYTGHRQSGTPDHQGDTRVEIFTRVVATSRDGANLLTDAVAEQLQGQPLAVAGRSVTGLDRDLEDLEYDPTARLYHRDAWFTGVSSRA